MLTITMTDGGRPRRRTAALSRRLADCELDATATMTQSQTKSGDCRDQSGVTLLTTLGSHGGLLFS